MICQPICVCDGCSCKLAVTEVVDKYPAIEIRVKPCLHCYNRMNDEMNANQKICGDVCRCATCGHELGYTTEREENGELTIWVYECDCWGDAWDLDDEET